MTREPILTPAARNVLAAGLSSLALALAHLVAQQRRGGALYPKEKR